jgi:hypothetical protein
VLIGVTGRAQHGKDSIGRILVEQYGFQRYAFADALKSMALALDPIVKTRVVSRTSYNSGGSRWDETYDDVTHTRLRSFVDSFGWEEAKKEPEVRRFLQVLGTEGVRDHLGEDAWVRALEKRMWEDGALPKGNAVVTDVRFPNEAAWIANMGGEVWRVKRVVWQNDAEPSQFDSYVPFDNGLGTDHPSERYVDQLPAMHEVTAADLRELSVKVRRLVS